MTWTKLDDRFPRHPKVLRAGPHAAWLYVCGLCYANEHLTDGMIPKECVPSLTALPKPSQAAMKLAEVGLWEDTGDAFRVHDFHEYNQSADEIREYRERERVRKASERKAHGHPPAIRPESNVPIPNPSPSSSSVGNHQSSDPETADDDETTLTKALDEITRRRLETVPDQQIRNRRAYERRVRDEVADLYHELGLAMLVEREWSPVELAEALEPPPNANGNASRPSIDVARKWGRTLARTDLTAAEIEEAAENHYHSERELVDATVAGWREGVGVT